MTRRWPVRHLVLSVLLVTTVACNGEIAPSDDSWPAVSFNAQDKAPKYLSQTGLVRWRDGQLQLHPEMLPYELKMPLFSDFSEKVRAIWLPPGTAIDYRSSGTLAFPEGAIIIKAFLFPEDLRDPDSPRRLIETRVLVRGPKEWIAWPYVWQADGSDAVLKITGDVQSISFIDQQGLQQTSDYLVPQRNQCRDCHDRSDQGERTTMIIGPRARFLHHATEAAPAGQLLTWRDRGQLNGADALTDLVAAEPRPSLEQIEGLTGDALARTARDYLDMNCAHCHSPTAVEGETSQLYLNHDNTNAFLFGVCKAPSSAGKGSGGLNYDIVPAKPDESILVFRLETTELGAMMPDLGRSLVDPVGVALVRKWIEEMEPVTCNR